MIKIIERGTKQTLICENCGCKFSFDEEDAYTPYVGASSFIECPQCHESIKIPDRISKKDITCYCIKEIKE